MCSNAFSNFGWRIFFVSLIDVDETISSKRESAWQVTAHGEFVTIENEDQARTFRVRSLIEIGWGEVRYDIGQVHDLFGDVVGRNPDPETGIVETGIVGGWNVDDGVSTPVPTLDVRTTEGTLKVVGFDAVKQLHALLLSLVGEYQLQALTHGYVESAPPLNTEVLPQYEGAVVYESILQRGVLVAGQYFHFSSEKKRDAAIVALTE